MVFEFSVLKNYFNIGDFIPYFSFCTITETIQQSDWDGSHLRDKVTLMLILGCVVSVCEHKYIYIFLNYLCFFIYVWRQWFYFCYIIIFLLYFYSAILNQWAGPVAFFFFNNQKWVLSYKMLTIPNLV